MTSEDMENLFSYLAIHFENNPKIHSKRLKSAWLELLEPYDPKDVKQALLRCLREKRYFPDVVDIAAKCPELPSEEELRRERRMSEYILQLQHFVKKTNDQEEAVQ